MKTSQIIGNFYWLFTAKIGFETFSINFYRLAHPSPVSSLSEMCQNPLEYTCLRDLSCKEGILQTFSIIYGGPQFRRKVWRMDGMWHILRKGRLPLANCSQTAAEICSGVETVEEVEMAEIGPVSPVHHFLHHISIPSRCSSDFHTFSPQRRHFSSDRAPLHLTICKKCVFGRIAQKLHLDTAGPHRIKSPWGSLLFLWQLNSAPRIKIIFIIGDTYYAGLLESSEPHSYRVISCYFAMGGGEGVNDLWLVTKKLIDF